VGDARRPLHVHGDEDLHGGEPTSPTSGAPHPARPWPPPGARATMRSSPPEVPVCPTPPKSWPRSPSARPARRTATSSRRSPSRRSGSVSRRPAGSGCTARGRRARAGPLRGGGDGARPHPGGHGGLRDRRGRGPRPGRGRRAPAVELPRLLATVRSEIVVLVRSGGRIVGQLDLDSDRVGAFSRDDHSFLSMIAARSGACSTSAPRSRRPRRRRSALAQPPVARRSAVPILQPTNASTALPIT